MQSKQVMTHFRPIAPPKLDRSALDGASQFRESVHNLLGEVSAKISDIEGDKTLNLDAVICRRRDIAKAAIGKLDSIAQSRLPEIGGRLAGLREKISFTACQRWRTQCRVDSAST
jgi:hypothetical protein